MNTFGDQEQTCPPQPSPPIFSVIHLWKPMPSTSKLVLMQYSLERQELVSSYKLSMAYIHCSAALHNQKATVLTTGQPQQWFNGFIALFHFSFHRQNIFLLRTNVMYRVRQMMWNLTFFFSYFKCDFENCLVM